MSKEKLEQNGCEKETLTIKECINRLETLFRSYSKDSEFNYQLSVSDSPFNQLKKLISWQPIENYQVGKHDWVLVQFEEKDTKFRCIPKVAEFRNGKWHSEDDSIGEETYLNEICKAIAFVDMQEQIIPIEKENKDEKMSKELTPLKALNDLIDYLESEHLDLSKEDHVVERKEIIETALKRLEIVEEENKLLRENNENLDEIYYDTWYACERLKESRYYALMFVDDVYCLVNTKDNKFDVIDTYEVKNGGIIDNGTQNKLKALEIIKEKDVHIFWLKESKTLEEYNKELLKRSMVDRLLTQEEFDLLREVLS